MSADIMIERATEKDAAGIAAILKELGWFAYINEEPPAKTEQRVSRHLQLCRADDSHTVLAAKASGGGVVGYAAVHWLPYLMLAGPEGYVSELFVLESERGKGIGRELLRKIEKEAAERGCTRLQLINGSGRESYERAFYRKLGWKQRPEMANFVLLL